MKKLLLCCMVLFAFAACSSKKKTVDEYINDFCKEYTVEKNMEGKASKVMEEFKSHYPESDTAAWSKWAAAYHKCMADAKAK